MTLPFAIGENSANEAVVVDFVQLPHLFVSYSDEVQVRQFIHSLVSSFQVNNQGIPLDYALAISGPSHNLSFPHDCFIKYRFIAGDELMSSVGSKEKFMLALSKEMRERSTLFKREAEGKTVKKYVPHMIILLHDVLDIILSHKKSISRIFLQLLLMGQALKMHVVAASCSTYRMLLRQLVHLNPSVMKKFWKHIGANQFNIITPLGAELVITAEDFIFFKEANALDYQRLYPVCEKSDKLPVASKEKTFFEDVLLFTN